MSNSNHHPDRSTAFWRFAAISTFILMLMVAFWRFGPKTNAPQQRELQSAESSAQPTKEETAIKLEQVDEVEKRKEELRQYWQKLVRVDLVEYNRHGLGGMSNVAIQVRNHMEFPVELIQVEVQYLLANGKVYKTIEVPVSNIPANGISHKVRLEDSKRGKTLRMNPVKIVCKAIEPAPHS